MHRTTLALVQEEVEKFVSAAPPDEGDSNRTLVLALMVILPAVSTLLVVIGGLRLRALLRRIPRISTRAQLETLGAEHRLHSIFAVLIRALLGIANVLFFVDLFILDGPITDLFYSIVPSLVSIAVSLPFRDVEQRVNELECANNDLWREWVALRQD